MRVLLILLLAAAQASVMTNDDVLTLTKAGLSPDVIISKITASTPAFHTDVRDLLALKAAHVDDTVVQAMVHATKSTTTTAARADSGLPPVRFGGLLIDLPGIRTYEGTLTISPTGITYEAVGFGTIQTAWATVESVCFETGYFGSLFVRVRERYTGTAASKVGRVVLLKCAPKVMRPAYEYLKRMHPTVTDDCSDKGKDVRNRTHTHPGVKPLDGDVVARAITHSSRLPRERVPRGAADRSVQRRAVRRRCRGIVFCPPDGESHCPLPQVRVRVVRVATRP